MSLRSGAVEIDYAKMVRDSFPDIEAYECTQEELMAQLKRIQEQFERSAFMPSPIDLDARVDNSVAMTATRVPEHVKRDARMRALASRLLWLIDPYVAWVDHEKAADALMRSLIDSDIEIITVAAIRVVGAGGEGAGKPHVPDGSL